MLDTHAIWTHCWTAYPLTKSITTCSRESAFLTIDAFSRELQHVVREHERRNGATYD